MKLNLDCIRDILLYLEENLTVETKFGTFNEIELMDLNNAFSEQYTEEDIWYTVYNLKEANYIDGKFTDAGDYKMTWCKISNIEWKGHQLLNEIRPQTVWEATKTGASKLGITSIHALSSISKSVITAIVTNPAVINNILTTAHIL